MHSPLLLLPPLLVCLQCGFEDEWKTNSETKRNETKQHSALETK